MNAIEHGTELSLLGTYGQSVSAVIDAVYRSHETGMEQDVGLDTVARSPIRSV